MHLKEIKNVVVPLPPLNIQKHIADTLEKTQEIIDGHKKQLQELDNLIKATFYEMFGDIKKNDKKWNQFKIGDVCIEQIQSLKSNEVVDITYIDISSISNTKKEIINFQKLNSSKAPSRAKQVLEFNDILVSTVRPNLNAVAINNIITDRKIIGSTGYCVLSCSNSINYKFLFEITKSCYFVNELVALAKGASYPAVSISNVKNVRIPLPPIELQNKFATIVTNIEEQKSIVKKALAESQDLFNSLMSKYFD